MLKKIFAVYLLLTAVFFMSPSLAQAASITRIQSATGSNSGGTTVAVTLTSAPQNGNALIAVIGTRGNSTGRVSSISQTGATWTKAVEKANTNGVTSEVWYALNVSSAGTSITVNLAASLKASVIVTEYAGVGSITALDNSASNSGNTNSPSTGTTATTSQGEEVWVGGMANINTNTYSAQTNGFLEVAEKASTGGSGASRNNAIFEEKIVTTTGTANVGATLSGTQQWAGVIATLKAKSVTISGNVYSDEGGTVWSKCDGTTQNISLVINGGTTQTTSCNVTTGAYSFTAFVSTGDPVSVFFNSNGGNSEKGVAVTKVANSVSNITLNPRKNIVWIKHENGVSSITLTDMRHCDKSAPAQCLTIPYDVDSNLVYIGDDPIKIHVQSGTTFAPSGASIVMQGSWQNDGTFTTGTTIVNFAYSSQAQTLSGNMTGSNKFYKLWFGVNIFADSTWTIKDPIEVGVTTDALDALKIDRGTLTLGDGNGDNLTLNGQMTITGAYLGGTANGPAIFQTAANLAQGSTINININNPTTPVTCANCIIQVGTATETNPKGTFILNKNAVLKFNSYSQGQSNLVVQKSGRLEVTGTQDDAGTSTSVNTVGLTETRLCAAKSWSNNQHNNKHVRITSGLAFGMVYPITATTANDSTNCTTGTDSSITRADSSSSTDTNPDVAGGTACVASGLCTINVADSLISANYEATGRFVHNLTQDKWYRIVDSKENTQDTLIITNYPDSMDTMHDGDDIEISDGVKVGDTFEIADYANIASIAGASCNGSQTNWGYMKAAAQSEVSVKYADICNLGLPGTRDINGFTILSTDGSEANQGALVEKSRIHDGIYGLSVYYSDNNNALNNLGFNNNEIYNNIYVNLIIGDSDNNLISYNRIHGTDGDGINITNASDGSGSSSKNNIVDNNITYDLAWGIAIYATGTDGNLISNNTVYKIYRDTPVETPSHSGIATLQEKGTIIDNNLSFGNPTITAGGFYGTAPRGNGFALGGADKAIVVNNSGFGNENSGFLSIISQAFFANNQSFGNSHGFYSYADPSTTNLLTLFNEQYGVAKANSTDDIFEDTAGTHKLTLLNSLLNSSTEVGIGSTGAAYVISKKHDQNAGQSRIWGKYTTSAGVDKYNYADNSFDQGNSDPAAWGAGNGTISVNTVPAAISLGYYRMYVTTAAANGGTFSIYKNSGAVVCSGAGESGSNTIVLPGTAGGSMSCTDSNGVKFTITDGSVDFNLGDGFDFAVFPKSSDTNTQKSLTFMRSDDYLETGTGSIVQLLGSSTFPTLVQKDGAATKYGFKINGGEINANYYQVTGTDNSGLNILSGTITDLSNGNFDSTGGDNTNSAYLSVDSSVLNSGAKSWTGMVFDPGGADSNIKYNVNLINTPSNCSNNWAFTATGNIAGEAFDNDRDSDCSGAGYLLWQ